jgi:hypothetical protein
MSGDNPAMARPIRIANASGFLGDRLAAPREMIDGGPIDVLTGDYLAELTMAILARQRMKDPSAGYARAFLDQMTGVLADCVARGIKVVANAGGLNPAGLAAALQDLADELGLTVRIASVFGDDVKERMGQLVTAGADFGHLDTGMTLAQRGIEPITANAYLGGWGIADALARDADVVVTGRVADASLVVGPAAWWHGWRRDEWDALAGAVVAGHVIECGTQATGGNYSFFEEIPGLEHPGFPIAEVDADGSAVITKHPGTGGAVTTGTVTAQLLYEVGGPRYLNPDVVARLDTVALEDAGVDRVRMSGVRGERAPATAKVSIVGTEGYRNSMTFVVTGLDIERKAELASRTLWAALGGRDAFARTEEHLVRADVPDPSTNEAAFAYLRFDVIDPDRKAVDRAFSNAAVELALASYPGLTFTTPPRRATPALVFWPATMPALLISQIVEVDRQVTETPPVSRAEPREVGVSTPDPGFAPVGGPTVAIPLGRLVGTRSGDKGGDANLGVWARSDEVYRWLGWYLTTDRLRDLLPETRDLIVERHVLSSLRALNFVVKGFLGEGVASSTKFDPQGKTLGEYLRAKVVTVPERLVVV